MKKKVIFNEAEFRALKEIIGERLQTLESTIKRHHVDPSEYEADIRNYITYDIHSKLMEVN